jgi:hypothetical protein
MATIAIIIIATAIVTALITTKLILTAILKHSEDCKQESETLN